MKTVKIKNIGEETLCFTGVPAIAPGKTAEVSQELADHLANHPSVEVVGTATKVAGKEKDQSFKGVE